MTGLNFKQTAAPKGPGKLSVLRPVSSVQKSKTGNQIQNGGLMVVLQARELLADPNAGETPKEKRVLDLLKKALEERGGSLETETASTGCRMVVGEARVSAGKATKERMVALGRNGRLAAEVLKETKGLDEKVVSKALGFGAGALAVSYVVDKNGNAEYVLRTNGSRACLEENKVNVAMALVGAAEIVEEMVKPPAGQEPAVELKTKAA